MRYHKTSNLAAAQGIANTHNAAKAGTYTDGVTTQEVQIDFWSGFYFVAMPVDLPPAATISYDEMAAYFTQPEDE